MHQEKEYPNRVIGTDLEDSKIVDLAKALGASAERIFSTTQFFNGFNRAVDSKKITVLELMTNPEEISTRTNLRVLRSE